MVSCSYLQGCGLVFSAIKLFLAFLELSKPLKIFSGTFIFTIFFTTVPEFVFYELPAVPGLSVGDFCNKKCPIVTMCQTTDLTLNGSLFEQFVHAACVVTWHSGVRLPAPQPGAVGFESYSRLIFFMFAKLSGIRVLF